MVDNVDGKRPPGAADDTYCPFGCVLGEGDERGYCDHLVGFVHGDGAHYEALKVRFSDGGWITGGMIADPEKKKKLIPDLRPIPALKKDKVVLVNPVNHYIDNDKISRVGKKWVSDRLYMLDPPEREVYKNPAELETEKKQLIPA